MPRRHLLSAALLLSGFGIVGTGLVAMTHALTADRIAEAQRQALLDRIAVLVAPERYDNELLNDVITISAPDALGTPETRVFRGRRQGEPAAAILSPVIAQGYNGAIRLIVAVLADGSLGGVRVLSHRETPGLGDKIERRRSDWIEGFSNRSLSNPDEDGWRVKRDGGEFDQFTGATITPRAVVGRVHQALRYSRQHWPELFAPLQEAQTK